MTQYFFNKSKIKLFTGVNLKELERLVNEFMATTSRIYNVKHSIHQEEGDYTWHYLMVSYEP